ncbi:hypothetical protein V8F20_010386, partial [Naviculisporaceae sp. PSN 640]
EILSINTLLLSLFLSGILVLLLSTAIHRLLPFAFSSFSYKLCVVLDRTDRQSTLVFLDISIVSPPCSTTQVTRNRHQANSFSLNHVTMCLHPTVIYLCQTRYWATTVPAPAGHPGDPADITTCPVIKCKNTIYERGPRGKSIVVCKEKKGTARRDSGVVLTYPMICPACQTDWMNKIKRDQEGFGKTDKKLYVPPTYQSLRRDLELDPRWLEPLDKVWGYAKLRFEDSVNRELEESKKHWSNKLWELSTTRSSHAPNVRAFQQKIPLFPYQEKREKSHEIAETVNETIQEIYNLKTVENQDEINWFLDNFPNHGYTQGMDPPTFKAAVVKLKNKKKDFGPNDKGLPYDPSGSGGSGGSGGSSSSYAGYSGTGGSNSGYYGGYSGAGGSNSGYYGGYSGAGGSSSGNGGYSNAGSSSNPGTNWGGNTGWR